MQVKEYDPGRRRLWLDWQAEKVGFFPVLFGDGLYVWRRIAKQEGAALPV